MTPAAVVLLGAFHGINPATGWLFAVAQGRRSAAATCPCSPCR
ncbi:hypothetical protein [Microbispora sp. CA-102843]